MHEHQQVGRLVADGIRNLSLEAWTESSEASNEAGRQQRDWLEHHAREVIIDEILEALNWHMRVKANSGVHAIRTLASEVGVRSQQYRTKRFLDYLGFDRETKRPLLLVEAKRPEFQLPVTKGAGPTPFGHPVAELLTQYLSKRSSGGQKSGLKNLTKEWMEHADTLKDYIRSIYAEIKSYGIDRLRCRRLAVRHRAGNWGRGRGRRSFRDEHGG